MPDMISSEYSIAIVDDYLTPYRIPIYRRLSHEFPHLRVFICGDNYRQQSWKIEESLGFPNETLPGLTLNLRRPHYGDPRAIRLNPTLLFRLMQVKPSLIVGYAFSVPAWTAFAYARLWGIGYVCWSTDTLHTERHLGPLQSLSRTLIIGGAGAFITASQAGVEKFVTYGVSPERVRIVTQRTLIQPVRRRRSHDSPGSGVTLRYVGTLSNRKGLDNLLRAMAEIPAGRAQVSLILVGDGPSKEALVETAEELGVRRSVRFEGFLQPERLSGIYADADIFVFPTLADTFGVALADAVSAGLPVVASVFAGATGEFVEDGLNGIKVDPRDPIEFSIAISQLANNTELREKMGRESLRIAARHPVDRAVSQFKEAIQLATR